MTVETTARVAARLEGIVVSVAELLQVECVGLLLQDSMDRLRTVCSTGAAADHLERAQESTGTGPGPDVHRAGISIAVTDVMAVPDYVELRLQLVGCGVRATMSAPVYVGDDIVGNLNALDPAPHRWNDQQHAALATFAAVIGDVLMLCAIGREQVVARLTDDLAELNRAPT